MTLTCLLVQCCTIVGGLGLGPVEMLMLFDVNAVVNTVVNAFVVVVVAYGCGVGCGLLLYAACWLWLVECCCMLYAAWMLCPSIPSIHSNFYLKKSWMDGKKWTNCRKI